MRKKFYFSTPLVVFGLTVIIWLCFFIFKPEFFRIGVFQNIASETTFRGIMGLGVLMAILTAGIDLSVGSLLAVVNVSFALMITLGVPIPVAVMLCLLIAMVCGQINGVLVYDLKLPPFIATLGMMIVLRGVAQIVSQSRTISGLPGCIASFGQANMLGLPMLFWILLVLVFLIQAVLHKTSFGRYTYAIGSNAEAARLSGVNTRLVMYGVYVLDAALVGVAGLLYTCYTNTGSPTAGIAYELDAIAAAVLGGASLSGAEGSAIGVFIGALMVATIQTLCVLLGVGPEATKLLIGLIIIFAVSADQIAARRRA
jgi:ribose transport system permease protein